MTERDDEITEMEERLWHVLEELHPASSNDQMSELISAVAYSGSGPAIAGWLERRLNDEAGSDESEMPRPTGTEAVLAYVERGCEGFDAYFVGDLAEAWGDDWNDAPYEHNAGPPYDEFTVEVVHFEGDFMVPCDDVGSNSPWSVEDINKGATPWLRGGGGKALAYAGCRLDDFTQILAERGGKRYLKGDR